MTKKKTQIVIETQPSVIHSKDNSLSRSTKACHTQSVQANYV